MSRSITSKFLLILALLWPVSSWATLSAGTGTSKQCTDASSCTTTAIATTTGNAIVTCAAWDVGTFSSLTDSASNGTPTQIQTELTGSGGITRCYYWANITGNASHTFTWTWSGPAFSEVSVFQVATTNAAGVTIDQSIRGNDAASPFTASVTTTVNDEICISYIQGSAASGTENYTAGGSFTELTAAEQTNASNSYTVSMASRVVSATGTQTPSWTASISTSANVWLATFSEAGGGGGSPPRFLPLLGVGQ